MSHIDSKAIDEHYAANLEFFRIIAGRFLHIGVYQSDSDDVDVAKQRTVDELVAWSGLISSSQVVDLGSGTGDSAQHVCKSYGCKVIGIEPIAGQVAYSNSKVPSELRDRLQFQVGRAENIPIESEQVDAVFSIEVLCHVEDLDRGLSECARILKPGGVLVFSDLVMLGKKSSATDFYFEFSKLPRTPDTIEQYKKRIAKNGFFKVEARDQSVNLGRNFRAGLKRVTSKRKQIVEKFGQERYDEVHSYCENGLSPAFLKEMGWAWFKAIQK